MGSSHITWNEWNNIPNLFLDLRTEEDFFDVTLAIDEDNQFPAHKVILSAASPFFRGLLKRNPSQHPSIVMSPHVRPTDLQNIIDFIYQGEVNVPQSELDNFLSVGEALKIRGLTPNGDDSLKKDKKPLNVPTTGPQMNRKRQVGPLPSQPTKQNPQPKRPRPGTIGGQMMTTSKFGGPQGPVAQNAPPSRESEDVSQGLDQDEATPVDEDSNDIYAEYGDETYETSEGFPMDTPPPTSGMPSGFSQPVLTRVICPNCRGKFTVEDLKAHMPTCQGPTVAATAQSQKPIKDPGEKTDICQFCDKAFKGKTNLKAHIRRTHRMPDGSLPTGPGDAGGQADFQEYQGVGGQEGGAMMDPSHPGSHSPHPGPGVKKKGRPRKVDQQQARPIGQVTPAPRPSNDIKNIHEQSRPPVQQDRGPSPMMQARQGGQRPPGMMSPSGGPLGNRRPMQPRGIMGPGMRPRGGSNPQQFQQGYPGQPMDIGLLGKKLGGSISITSSESSGGQGGNTGGQPQQASMRRPMPSTSRGMHASSPKSDPLASSMGGPARQPSLGPAQRQGAGSGSGSMNQDPVEVKQEPIDDIYEEDMHDDFEGDEDEEGDFGEEEEEGEEDQDFEQGPMDGMYAGESPYDDDVEHDQAAYQQ